MAGKLELAGERRKRVTPLERLEQVLGEQLLREKWLTFEQLAKAHAHQREHGGRLSTCLWEIGLATEEELRNLLGQHLDVPCAAPAAVEEGVRALPRPLLAAEAVAGARAIPFRLRQDAVLVATSEPWRLALFDDLAERMHLRVEPCFLDEAPLARLLEALFRVAAHPRFHAEPRLRRAPREAEKPGDDPFPDEELLSDSSFRRSFDR